MKKIWSVAAVAAVVVLCGCQHTSVDQVKASEGMNDWYQYIKDNYPGFQPPPLVSPGITGQTAAATAENGKTVPPSFKASFRHHFLFRAFPCISLLFRNALE